MSISVPISVGEFIDKLTILEIKSERITDPAKRRNVALELEVLKRLWHASGYAEAAIAQERTRLKALNGQLWEVEDLIRDKERESDFDHEFIALARSVYRLNDERAETKRAINLKLGSAFVEEKSYSSYDPTA
ncbi:MAG: DUF6165 family protein [Rhodospirillales bacterium]|nr:DUF6165 family protein [Rhodospirillales bacterium]